MNELSLEDFQHAIRQTHGAEAELVDRVRLVEEFWEQPVWEGEVLVFELEGHPTATRCYAWEVDGEVTAVLHTGPVDSPVKAVRASILAEAPEATEGGRRMPIVDSKKAEAVRARMVALLGRKVEMRIPPDTSAVVEYRLGGQTIRISSERFEDHEITEDIFPMDAVRSAGDGHSFLLTTDDRIIPDNS